MSADIAIADTSDSDGRKLDVYRLLGDDPPDCDVIAAAATVAIANTPIGGKRYRDDTPVRGAVSSAEIRLLLRLATLLPT